MNDEFGRLQEKFGYGYQRWKKGEALDDGNWYDVPIAPGMPGAMTLTKIVGSIALTASGNPWLAFALNTAMTGVSVADGSLAWKHALVQTGVSFASAYTGGVGGQLINMGSSGIKYNPDGGLGWSNKQLVSGIKSGAIGYALTGAMGTSAIATGLKSSLMSAIQTDGKWYEPGFDTSNIAEHLTVGVSSGLTAALMKKDAQGKPMDRNNKENPNVMGTTDSSGYTGDVFYNKAISGLI